MGVVRGEDGVGLVEDMADVEAKKLVEVEVGVGLVEDMTDVEAKKSEEVEVGPLVVVMLVVVILVVVELIMEVELLIMEVDLVIFTSPMVALMISHDDDALTSRQNDAPWSDHAVVAQLMQGCH